MTHQEQKLILKTWLSSPEEEKKELPLNKDPKPSANYLEESARNNLLKQKHGHTTRGISSDNVSRFSQETLETEEGSSIC